MPRDDVQWFKLSFHCAHLEWRLGECRWESAPKTRLGQRFASPPLTFEKGGDRVNLFHGRRNKRTRTALREGRCHRWARSEWCAVVWNGCVMRLDMRAAGLIYGISQSHPYQLVFPALECLTTATSAWRLRNALLWIFAQKVCPWQLTELTSFFDKLNSCQTWTRRLDEKLADIELGALNMSRLIPNRQDLQEQMTHTFCIETHGRNSYRSFNRVT